MSNTIYWSAAVPQEWIQNFQDLQEIQEPGQAELSLTLHDAPVGSTVYGRFTRIFAVAAPFPTVTDAVSLQDLQAVWHGEPSSTGEFSKIYVTEATKNVFTELWGIPSDQTVLVYGKEDLVTELWKATDAWAIVPFEEIEPKLKILQMNGISPIDRPMDVDNYPLTITYTLAGKAKTTDKHASEIAQILTAIPATNRDEAKMAVVVMSGTTALARVTLKKIELNGYDYPIDLIKNWFLSADLRHVSNEVSFADNCEYTDARTMTFCSKPDQIKVFEDLGVNVVESTGNHLNDYGSKYFVQTLQMYKDRGWLNFGGGINEEAARQPATTVVNGNKIAFIGCNPVGFETDWATDKRAGSANCDDYAWFNQEITKLKSEGYVVIATFQFVEIDQPMYDSYFRTPFREAAKAGADIVQGSQAHVPMGFEFVGNSLIHYGLGNLLFDQMEPINLREFVDRHIIYNGKYISTELLTASLSDWSRPVPMTEKNREKFLTELFAESYMR
jgi:poly-gamma-glutamate synthesis protein (capsule biosynthesis protein)